MEVAKEIEKFSSYMLGERKSPHTIKEYRFLVSIFLEFSGKPIDKCTPTDIESYKNFLASERNYSKTSQYLAIKALRHFYKFKGINPPLNLTVPKRPKKMPNYLNEKEASRLLAAAGKDLRTNLIVSLLAHTGMRVGELCSLKVDDIDLDEGVIGIYSGKGDRDRIVIIPDELKDLIRSYLPGRYEAGSMTKALIIGKKGTGLDTSTVQRIVRNLAKEAGIAKKVTPHVLRHTFATAVLRNGGDIRFIQQLLGHASVATTQIYTHVDDNTLREMYQKHKPKY